MNNEVLNKYPSFFDDFFDDFKKFQEEETNTGIIILTSPEFNINELLFRVEEGGNNESLLVTILPDYSHKVAHIKYSNTRTNTDLVLNIFNSEFNIRGSLKRLSLKEEIDIMTNFLDRIILSQIDSKVVKDLINLLSYPKSNA